MKKRFFNMIIILAIIIGAVSGSAVYASGSNKTNSTSVTNNTVGNQINATVLAEDITPTNAEETVNTTTTTNEESKDKGLSNHDIGLLAAALATGLGCIGAGIAVAMVASSAIGAISENPSLLGKTIIFAGLAEGIAIYGLIISIMILNKI